MGREGDYYWSSAWKCGDRKLFAIWTCCFPVKFLTSVSAHSSKINRRCFDEFHPFIPLCLFKMRKYTNTIRPNSIGGNNTPAPIGKAGQISRINFQTIAILRIFMGGPPGITNFKSQLDAPIYWRRDSWEKHFVSALPIGRDIAIKLSFRKRKRKNYKLKLQITLDRHSPRLMLIYCLLPDPSYFSLLSTYI